MSISNKKRYIKLNKKYGKLPEVRFYPNPTPFSVNRRSTYVETMREVVQYIMGLPLRDQIIVSQIMQLD